MRNLTIEKEERKKHHKFELQQETSNTIEFEYSILSQLHVYFDKWRKCWSKFLFSQDTVHLCSVLFCCVYSIDHNRQIFHKKPCKNVWKCVLNALHHLLLPSQWYIHLARVTWNYSSIDFIVSVLISQVVCIGWRNEWMSECRHS